MTSRRGTGGSRARQHTILALTVGLWIAMGLGLVAVVALVTPPAGGGWAFRLPWAPEPAAQPATAGRIAADPGPFVGREVTLGGEVTRVVGPYAFTVGGQSFAEPAELLVLWRPALPPPATEPAADALRPGDIALVTGLVRRLEVRAAERELGIDLEDGRLAAWSGRPVLLARTVTRGRAPTGARSGGTAGGGRRRPPRGTAALARRNSGGGSGPAGPPGPGR